MSLRGVRLFPFLTHGCGGVMQAAVLQGHRGALHALLLLFLCAHTRDGGSLGGVSLDSHLRLAGLFAPERAA